MNQYFITQQDMVGGGHFHQETCCTNILVKKLIVHLLNQSKKNKIRRIARGLYDYPRYSELLKQNLSPDIEKVAQAIAGKFNWNIEVSGDTALNLLGLSTQVVGKYIYLTNGANRSYKILDNITIEFKKSALKNIGFKHRESILLVQALKSLGKERIDDEIISKLQNTIEKSMCDKILKDTKTVTNWIYEVIKKVCVKGCENEK